jgi:hypothetical protein
MKFVGMAAGIRSKEEALAPENRPKSMAFDTAAYKKHRIFFGVW